MTRTTLTLPTEVLDRVKSRARAEGVSVAQALRSAVVSGLSVAAPITPVKKNKLPKRDPLFAVDFTFSDDLPDDVSENVSKYVTDLAQEKYERGHHR